MDYPFISAKCITYGRVDFLEESVQSFLQQEYPGQKELIIVNDYPLQELIYDHPEIKIYNLDETFATIGEKENFAMSKCSGDIICQWDDDDIALPNHLSNVAKYLTKDYDIIHWKNGAYCNNDRITSLCFIGNSGICFTKSVWEKVGGHPIENAGYDMTFIENIHRLDNSRVLFVTTPLDEVSWFYMWGGRGYHMSGQGHDTADRPNAIQRHSEHVEGRRLRGEIPTGDVSLSPNWRQDYSQLLKDFIK
jgi:glycosyltransferase involved in cell wall biosynthesis